VFRHPSPRRLARSGRIDAAAASAGKQVAARAGPAGNVRQRNALRVLGNTRGLPIKQSCSPLT
jgi:hypothetical protein